MLNGKIEWVLFFLARGTCSRIANLALFKGGEDPTTKFFIEDESRDK